LVVLCWVFAGTLRVARSSMSTLLAGSFTLRDLENDAVPRLFLGKKRLVVFRYAPTYIPYGLRTSLA